MRTDYFAQIPLTLSGGEVAAGTLLGTIETAEGIPLEKFVNAVAVGHATSTPLPSGAVVQEKKLGALETAEKVTVMDEGHDR